MATLSRPDLDLVLPERLPFLESLSWFDRNYRDLPLLDILRRYESGWRYVLADCLAQGGSGLQVGSKGRPHAST
jgi:hypothetical protein